MCLAEGYVQRDSITIVKHSIGRASYLKGGVDYHVTFQADICMPHVGQVFKAPVTLRSKIGIHAELEPLRILIPRDLHVGNEIFEKVDVGDTLEFQVVGTQFKQGDEDIIVIGKLMKNEEAEPEVLGEEEKASETAPPSSSGPNEKQVVVLPTAPSDKPKRRRLKQEAPATE
jgi:DNA-directed RNA polymerase subunit E'/Rpb7